MRENDYSPVRTGSVGLAQPTAAFARGGVVVCVVVTEWWR